MRMLPASLICSLCVSLGLYWNTFKAGFVYDDKRAILENPDVIGSPQNSLSNLFLNDFWGTRIDSNHSHGSYRPLTILTFRWTHSWIGHFDAYWYHVTNVFLHCLVTAAVTRLSQRVSGRIGVWTTSLLFAAHPIHCEAVAGLVGRADILCTLFFLSGLEAYLKSYRPAVTVGWSLAAFLAKEYGIMLLPLCFLYDLCVNHKRILKDRKCRIILGGSFLILMAMRFYLSGFRVLPQFAPADNPTARSPFWITRTLTFLYLPVFHFGLLLWPKWLSFDWSMSAIPPIESLNDWRNLSSLIFYTFLAFAIRRMRHNSSLSISILLIIIPFLPATNLFAYVGFVVAERILYLPSVGFCLLVGAGMNRLFRKDAVKESACCIGLLVIIALGYRTVQRNEDWKDEESLYRSGIPINPPKAYGNLGVILQDSGRKAEAEWSYKQALIHRPNMADVFFNLGNLYQEQNRHIEALRHYDLAITFRPNLAESYHQKAMLLDKLGRKEEAEKTLLDCVRISDQDWITKDHSRHLKAKTSAAILLANLNQLTKNNKNSSMAEKDEAGAKLSESIRQNEAAEALIRAADLRPDSIPYAISAAHALHEAHRNPEAELYFRRAAQLDPKDVSLQVNLGAVLHVQGKFIEAERVYRKALELVPNHLLTLTNLRRLHGSWNRSCQTGHSTC